MFSKKAHWGLFLISTILISFSFNTAFNDQQKSVVDEKYYLFFDLGDVLVRTSQAKSFNKNKSAILKYMIKNGIPDKKQLKSRLFELMDHTTNYPPRGTATNNGEFIPQIMCDWMIGKISSYEFVKIITNISPSDKFFINKAEGKLLIAIAKLMLPKELIDIIKKTDLVKTFKKCAECDANRVCILSNWDKDSIDLLKQKFPEIFNLIPDKNIIFSGECGYKKPDANIYKFAAKQVGANLEKCVLIDDQKDNIDGAKAFGWQGIHHTKNSITIKWLDNYYGFACS